MSGNIMNINFSMLRGRETIAEHRKISDYASQSGGNDLIKQGKDISNRDIIWNNIIESSVHGRDEVDKLFKLYDL